MQLEPGASVELFLAPRLLRVEFTLVGPVLRFRPALNLLATVAQMIMACFWGAALEEGAVSNQLPWKP